MVNYCPKCGTTFADLEVRYVERVDPLYFLKYGPFTLATVRPETKFGDTAVAVHPKDTRYQKYIGKEIEVDGLNGAFKMNVIADEYVDPEFGTGVVKVTPAHDKNDYEAGKRHNLTVKRVIDLNGRLNKLAGKYAGLTVFSARKKVAEDLEKEGLLVKVDKTYKHTVATCYKGGHDIEPMIVPNWFVKVNDKKKSFKMPALSAVKKGDVAIYPKWREKTYIRWMEEMHDWPISRQVVWGIRIPVWYDVEKNPDLRVTFLSSKQTITGKISDLLREYSLSEIESGLQNIFAPAEADFTVSVDKPKKGKFLPETDTFDTWFSSGQWPLVTLGYPDSKDFKQFYPTSVLETGWEIIRLWVSRMIMFGLYLTKKPPFRAVYLHGIVRSTDGRKMSKSLGNVINPEEYQKQFGTDALRMGLISGTANGKDFNFPKDKIVAYRNFANKLWNIARFVLIQNEKLKTKKEKLKSTTDNLKLKENKAVIKQLNNLINKVTQNLEKYRFAQAAEEAYHFTWHTFADDYIEKSKSRNDAESLFTLNFSFLTILKLLHPFMPFITEAIWQELPEEIRGSKDVVMIATWPVASSPSRKTSSGRP
jgi:valyl-tRNA synthetase